MKLYAFDGDNLESDVRIVLELNEHDSERFRALPGLQPTFVPIKVTDQTSGKQYLVGRADCGADDYCAALAVVAGAGAKERFIAIQVNTAEERQRWDALSPEEQDAELTQV